MISINVILYDNFETLDACGPIEMFGQLKEDCCLGYYSPQGGLVKSLQGLACDTEKICQMKPDGILLVPGSELFVPYLDDTDFLSQLKSAATSARYCLAVCTGSCLVAKTGLLKGRKATTNKSAYGFVQTLGLDVEWMPKARWVMDGKFYTSSGVSAGMDMALGFIADYWGREKAGQAALAAEYCWNSDPADDPFSR